MTHFAASTRRPCTPGSTSGRRRLWHQELRKSAARHAHRRAWRGAWSSARHTYVHTYIHAHTYIHTYMHIYVARPFQGARERQRKIKRDRDTRIAVALGVLLSVHCISVERKEGSPLLFWHHVPQHTCPLEFAALTALRRHLVSPDPENREICAGASRLAALGPERTSTRARPNSAGLDAKGRAQCTRRTEHCRQQKEPMHTIAASKSLLAPRARPGRCMTAPDPLSMRPC